jgi:small acid-soluble spore protein E (minor gamma-type SASP)
MYSLMDYFGKNLMDNKKNNGQIKACGGDYGMAKKNKTSAGTNVNHVKQQNAQAAQGQGQFGTEFASETDAQEVRKQNQKSQSNKQ